MRHFFGVEVGDAHWRLYRLPVVIGRAEPQESGGIAQAWIEDPKVYPVYQYPNDGVRCLRRQWWLHVAVLLKFRGFCC